MTKGIGGGPYAETKEQFGGISILEDRDLNHAIQLVSERPGFKCALGPITRPAGDLNQLHKVSQQGRRRNTMRTT